jgi:hypothetical protein
MAKENFGRAYWILGPLRDLSIVKVENDDVHDSIAYSRLFHFHKFHELVEKYYEEENSKKTDVDKMMAINAFKLIGIHYIHIMLQHNLKKCPYPDVKEKIEQIITECCDPDIAKLILEGEPVWKGLLSRGGIRVRIHEGNASFDVNNLNEWHLNKISEFLNRFHVNKFIISDLVSGQTSKWLDRETFYRVNERTIFARKMHKAIKLSSLYFKFLKK